MTDELLLQGAKQIAEECAGEDMLLTSAKIVAFLMDNCDITVPENSEFFVKVNGRQVTRTLYREQLELQRAEFFDEFRPGQTARAYTGRSDFGHTAPGWTNIINLGLPGLRSRIENRKGEARNPHFVEAELMVFDAAERFLTRAAEAAETAGKCRMADGIRSLMHCAPQNLYEGFQMTLLFYTLEQYFDGTDIRTMGRLDSLLYHLYQKETDSAYVDQLAEQYLHEIHALRAAANMPFALGGSDENGHSLINELSYVLLNAYARTKLSEVKLHILCTLDMPREFLRICMQSIKDGGNSLVFINDKLVVDGLKKLGQSPDDAQNYYIVGCYEACGAEEIPCSCNARVSIPKALEYTLHGGKDIVIGEQIGLELPVNFPTYEDLYNAFTQNLVHLSKQAIAVTNAWESRYPRTHASPFYSASLTGCVENGGDAYSDFGARYNNSSINGIGLGTAVDSLYTIRTLVYEERRLSLQELIQILDSNWEGQEVLRLYIKNRLPKFGVGNKEIDAIAADVVQTLSDTINNAPNAKGGIYRLGLFSINWRIDFGKVTAASADGRKLGDTLSQNTSGSFGSDKEGLTGHINSVCAIRGEDVVNGSVLDLEMHSSAVRGNNGTDILIASLDTFLQQGGQTVHYNVLDTATLRDAQIHPENHANLQVRMCGWNELFTHLSKTSQDEFIYRSELNRG